MILPFNESWFVVTFYGECPQSTLIRGWENVLDHIDKEMGNKEPGMPPEASVCSPCCELHDVDNWNTLGSCYMNNDDERHTFTKNEFGYCVGLSIVRLTEPVEVPVTV
jgi:hypothetical protein